jgi:hypothetical protein
MGGLVWFEKIFHACQGPTSFIAYERGWVIFEYSHVFRSGGSLMGNGVICHPSQLQTVERMREAARTFRQNSTANWR